MVDDSAMFYLVAFMELQHDRNEYGFIPFTSIDAYARRYRVRGGLYEEFLRVIRGVNVEINGYLEDKRKKAPNGDRKP